MGKNGDDMENGKSVANWWQNIGIDMYGIFVYKSKKATKNVRKFRLL